MIRNWILILCFYQAFMGCKSAGTPYFPLHVYKTIIHAPKPTQEDILRADKGVYRLDVVLTDTLFARKHIEYYSTQHIDDRRKQVSESVFLYFIDDYRFVYTKKPLDTLDIHHLSDKKTKLGVYYLTKLPKTNEVIVSLYMADSKVKQPLDFEYGLIHLHLSDDGTTLRFRSADYPLMLKTERRPTTNAQQPFSPDVLNQATNKLYQLPNRYFESEQLGLVATWYFKAMPLVLTIDGKTFDFVGYPVSPLNAEKQTRHYLKDSQKIDTEEIHEDHRNNILKTW